MARPVSFAVRTLADNTKKQNGKPETTTFRVPIATLTAANVVAQQGLQTAFNVAVAGITLGQVNKTTLVYAETQGVPGPSSNPLAQREIKWLCRYHDATDNQNYQISLGTADISLLENNSEFLDLTADEGLAFKDAWEDFVVSPSDPTHATVLDSVQFVGRNT